MLLLKVTLLTQRIVLFCVLLGVVSSIAIAQTRPSSRSALLRKPPKEVAVLRGLALAGDANAAWVLFLHYDLGVSNWGEAEVWLKLAAKLGNQRAKQTIKQLPHIGLNRSRSRNADLELPRTEVTILRENALAGDKQAAWTLFLHYGLGLNREKEAEYWLKLAAKLGSDNAREYIIDRKAALGKEP